MQLVKFYRRRLRSQLNAATLNACVQIGAFIDEGWAAWDRVSTALGEVTLLGGVVEELPQYDTYLKKLRLLQRSAREEKKVNRQCQPAKSSQ